MQRAYFDSVSLKSNRQIERNDLLGGVRNGGRSFKLAASGLDKLLPSFGHLAKLCQVLWLRRLHHVTALLSVLQVLFEFFHCSVQPSVLL